VKAEQPDASLRQTRGATVTPGESLMPHEIVEHGCLHRESRGPQIMAAESDERFENCNLNYNSNATNHRELYKTLHA
jgi:hypothetical protein